MMQRDRRAARFDAIVLSTVAVCALAACAAPDRQVNGRIASGGGYLGDWDLYPNECAAVGDGALLDVSGYTRRRVRVVGRARAHGAGAAPIEVRVLGETERGPMEIVLSDASCVRGTLAREGGETAGTFRVDCDTGEGGHVIGEMTFAHCR
jgi:hypothetical protein